MDGLRQKIRNAVYWVLDTAETAVGRRDLLTPPRRLMNVGSNSRFRNDFNAIGDELLGYLTRVGAVEPTDRVLDIGCGVGRMAIQLTRFLSGPGSYSGFDIVRPSIEYCQQAITPRFPRFQFIHADVFNTHYNPNGKVAPEDFQFPYPDASFDFVFLTSVFTHMRHREVEHYLREIHRVMAPGATCYSTFFLLDEDTIRRIEDRTASRLFMHPVEHGRVSDASDPDAAIAFDVDFVRGLHQAAGLEMRSVHRGTWRGIASDTGYQDIVLSVRS